MTRKATEERRSLARAFLACVTWREESGLLIGEHAGWRIWLSDRDGHVAGLATNLEMDATVELEPETVRPWARRARRLLARRR